MRPSFTAMSHAQPLLHNVHADCTQSSTSAAVSPGSRCWSTRTGQEVSLACGVRVPQRSLMRSAMRLPTPRT
ncbi:hypothetical protein SZMC14600_11568 [Saccharomonospora azurea SZMC 14600]|nr:hypothetical protein SZMC14600_11568 [Saccharomonospora azurea SZMC 14600]